MKLSTIIAVIIISILFLAMVGTKAVQCLEQQATTFQDTQRALLDANI